VIDQYFRGHESPGEAAESSFPAAIDSSARACLSGLRYGDVDAPESEQVRHTIPASGASTPEMISNASLNG
jgi:hypothetical protein